MPHASVSGIEIYYELTDFTEPWGSKHLPVVMMHGLGMDHRTWLYQVPEFSKMRPVVTVDLRGHGQSTDGENPLTISDMAKDIAALVRNLGFSSAHFVGLSLGGLVAQKVALQDPDVAASLVLLGTACGFPDDMLAAVQEGLVFVDNNDVPAIAQVRVPRIFTDRIDPALRDFMIDEVSKNRPSSYKASAHAAYSFDIRDEIKAIRAPTLVVVGEEDEVTPLRLSEDICRRIPGAELKTISDASHAANIDNAPEFNLVLQKFLADLP